MSQFTLNNLDLRRFTLPNELQRELELAVTGRSTADRIERANLANVCRPNREPAGWIVSGILVRVRIRHREDGVIQQVERLKSKL